MPRKPTPGMDSLGADRPDISAQWHPTWNGKKTPEDYLAGSGVKVWWSCDLGHAWSAQILSRVRGAGCPYCAHRKVLAGFNDLATEQPLLVAEWNVERNGRLRPQDVMPTSSKKVWWRCDKGHSWRASVANRSDGSGYPSCWHRRDQSNGVWDRVPRCSASAGGGYSPSR